MNHMAQSQKPLLKLEGLAKRFKVGSGFLGSKKRWLRAVDQVDLAIQPGEVMGLVGESGCGKSTLGRLALRLLDPSAGRVLFQGQDVTALDRKALRSLRGRMQIVFQDPMTSLNPRLTVGSLLGEPFVIHGHSSRAQVQRQVGALLEEVGLRPEHARRYPHQFSGGQR